MSHARLTLTCVGALFTCRTVSSNTLPWCLFFFLETSSLIFYTEWLPLTFCVSKSVYASSLLYGFHAVSLNWSNIRKTCKCVHVWEISSRKNTTAYPGDTNPTLRHGLTCLSVSAYIVDTWKSGSLIQTIEAKFSYKCKSVQKCSWCVKKLIGRHEWEERVCQGQRIDGHWIDVTIDNGAVAAFSQSVLIQAGWELKMKEREKEILPLNGVVT